MKKNQDQVQSVLMGVAFRTFQLLTINSVRYSHGMKIVTHLMRLDFEISFRSEDGDVIGEDRLHTLRLFFHNLDSGNSIRLLGMGH